MQMLVAVVLALALSPPRSDSLMADSPPLTSLATSRGFVSAEQLKGLCEAPEGGPGGLFDVCLGYLAGSIDQMVARDTLRPRTGRLYCPITKFSLGEFREAFVVYMNGHPELGKAAAAAIVERSASAILSCKPLDAAPEM